MDININNNEIEIELKKTPDINIVLEKQGPKGEKGEKGEDGGADGACVESVAFVGNDMVFTLDDASTITLTNAKTDLKGEQGPQGIPGPKGEDGIDGKILPSAGVVNARKYVNGLVTELSEGFEDWYGNGTVGYITTDKKVGTGSILTITPSNTDRTMVFKADMGPKDFSKSFFRIWVKCSHWDDTAGQIRMHTDYENYFHFTTTDYYGVTDHTNNEWVELIIPRSAFKAEGTPSWSNINHIAFASWSADGVISSFLFNGFTEHPDSPKGSVSFCFDDGWESAYTNGARIMDEYGYVGTHYIIPDELGTPNHMTQEMVDDLHDRGWAIGGHNGSNLLNMTPEQAEAAVKSTHDYLAEHNYRGRQHYAYPNGGNNDAIRKIVQKYFATGRTINPLGGSTNYVSEYRISAFSLYQGIERSMIWEAIDAAVANNEWVILNFHRIGDMVDEIAWSEAEFRQVLDYVRDSGVRVTQIGDFNCP